MQEFWVQGGEYVDGKSDRLAEGASLESYGPFYSYHDARRDWQARTLSAVEHAKVRYRIVPFRPDAPSPSETTASAAVVAAS